MEESWKRMNHATQIKLSQVTKRYGQRMIFEDICLTVNAGETVTIIGPSGGGKSTLLRCINGLTHFDAGEIRVGSQVLLPKDGNGKPVDQIRRQFGFVFQDYQLFPHLSALENVIEAPVHVACLDRASARDRGLHLLERVNLADKAHAYPQQLSGGQKQRVAIARALAMEPRGLLCDEITSALDPELKSEVLRVLEDLKRDGLTLLMVTHEIGFARRAADRIVFLADGKIVEEGPPHRLLDRPNMSRTKRFLDCVVE